MSERIRKIFSVCGGLRTGKTITPPRHCHLDINDHCPLNCLGCWTHSRHEFPVHRMPFEVISRVLTDLSTMGCRSVALAGRGEPLLHPEITRVIGLCDELGIQVSLTTSGYALASKSGIFQAGTVDLVKLSLWGYDEKTLRETCSARDYQEFASSLKAAAALSKKVRMEVSCIINRFNYKDPGAFLELAEMIGAKRISFSPVVGIEMGISRKDVLLLCSNLKALKKRTEQARLTSNIDDFIMKMEQGLRTPGQYRYRQHKACVYGWDGLRILANGNVVFCCECVDVTLGNVHNVSIKDIWFGELYQSYRKKAFYSGCVEPEKGKIACCHNSGSRGYDLLRRVGEGLGGRVKRGRKVLKGE